MAYVPLIIAVLVYAAARGVYEILPNAYDGERSFFWGIGAFLIVYIAVAAYVTHAYSPF